MCQDCFLEPFNPDVNVVKWKGKLIVHKRKAIFANNILVILKHLLKTENILKLHIFKFYIRLLILYAKLNIFLAYIHFINTKII